MLMFISGKKSFITATTLAKGAFPALSPIPLTVRCKPLTPALTASIVLATLRS